ncbi:MAG: lipoprotein [Candidatus Frackibacter sp. T328-2]|nr:MAG: lipoprotein [Candidatus Frackibacter sp. T328-2]
MIKNRKTLVLLVILLIFAIGLTGCSSSSGSKKYIVTITTKVIDSTTGKIVQTATTKTASGKQGSTSGGITKFTLDGNKEYTFVSSAPYYAVNKKQVRIGKENIVITIKLSQKEGKVLGKVVDEVGNKLKGATVSLVELNKKTETNSDGTFKFIEVPITGTTYTLEISKSGYGKRTLANLEIPAGENKKDVGKIVLSNNPGILSGKITDPTGSALNGVNVSIVELGKNQTTDYSGNFEFEVLPGTYSLEFTNSDYQKVTRKETVQSDKTTFVSIEMTPKPGQISGIVLDNYGVPINDVQVSILGANKQTKTLSNGHFLLEDVPPGNYTLEFIHPQFQIYNVTADVKRAQETNLGNIMLQEKTGMLTGRVLEDSTGNPIANVNVEIQETGVSTSTNSNGYYTFNNLRIGTYKLQISAVNYSTEEVSNVVVKENSVTSLNDVRLIKDPATIIGTVKSSLTDEPLADITVNLNETGTSVKTSLTGSFEFPNLKAGTYSISLSSDTYYNDSVNSIYCGPDSTTNLGVVYLDPKPVKITGVTDPGVTVTIQETGDTVTTDSTGSFTFTGLDPGNYTIGFTKANYNGKTKSLSTKPGQTYDLGILDLTPEPMHIIGSSQAETIYIVELDKTISHPGGTFDITINEPGDYTLRFSKSGYEDKDITINSLAAGETRDIGTVSLTPLPSTIKGYVDSSLTDVNVKLLETADGKTLANGGYFEFAGLNPNTYNIEFSKTNYETKTITKSGVGPDEVVDLGTITLNPLPGKIVGATNADTVKIKQTGETQTITGDLFSFNNMEPGDYTLRFTKANYYSKEVPVTVNANQTVDVGTITLQATEGTIEGYLNTKSNVYIVDGSGRKFTNYQGYYSFNNLSTPEDYYIRYFKPNFYPVVKKVSLNPGETYDLGSAKPQTGNNLGDGTLSQDSTQVRKFQSNNTESITTKDFVVDFDQNVTFNYMIDSWDTSGDHTGDHYVGVWLRIVGLDNSIDKDIAKVGALMDFGEPYTIFSYRRANPSQIYLPQGRYRMYIYLDTQSGDRADIKLTVNYSHDNKNPVINYSKNYGDPSTNHSVNITVSDDSKLSSIKYKWSTSKNKPSVYSSISNGDTVTQNTSGVWYLHVEATDEFNNSSYIWQGPFIVK